jgi:hypothetical protein
MQDLTEEETVVYHTLKKAMGDRYREVDSYLLEVGAGLVVEIRKYSKEIKVEGSTYLSGARMLSNPKVTLLGDSRRQLISTLRSLKLTQLGGGVVVEQDDEFDFLENVKG